MLAKMEFPVKPERQSYKTEIDKLELQLKRLQREIIEENIPVLLMFEGWPAAGKGTMINRLMQSLDPRRFRVYPIHEPTMAEHLRPYLWRFWVKMPAAGDMTILDRSWYHDLVEEEVYDRPGAEVRENRYRQISELERTLHDNGTIIIKFFLHISKGEQRDRFNKLAGDQSTAWRIDKNDWKHHKRYKKFRKEYSRMIEQSNRRHAPWIVVPAENRRQAALTVFGETISHLKRGIAASRRRKTRPPAPPKIPVLRRLPLDAVDLSRTLDREEYRAQLKVAQQRVRELEHHIFRHRLPVTIIYQGWDAAGKGGNIKRLTQRMDPRGYEVIPIGAPSRDELDHHYLWRFWRRIPKAGHIAIFDRSWYGRVLVERVEGFATEAQWKRAYREIKEFERTLVEEGQILIKFWIHIDQDEQLQRFEDRKKDPYKKWKITEEDWRNREKWPLYQEAVNQMISLTSTPEAPWTIVEGNSKYFARIKALNTVIAAIEDRI